MGLLETLDPTALRARITGRSYWRVRYRDGTIVNEWDGPDWSLLPRKGLVAVRLYCPNGQVAELGNSVDASDRLFQLKQSIAVAGVGRKRLLHLIGMVVGLNGEAQCAAWEYGPDRLITFEDNVFSMRYGNIGRLAAEHLGIKPD